MVGARQGRPLANVDAPRAAPERRIRTNLSEMAYERIEDLIINCELKPGRFLAI